MSSTIQNLQFLEAQLDEYLHSHEDDGTTLWVTPQGMRMPYKKTRENLEQNMKFVEVQLEKYLHEHEIDTTTSEEVANVVPDPEVDLSTGQIPGGGDSIPAGMYFWSNAGHPQEQVSTANPRVGSNHIRSSISGNANADIFPMDPTVSSVNKPVMSASGDTATASVWARQDPAQGHAITFEYLFYNSGGSSIGFNDDNEIGTLTTSYQLFESAPVTLPTGTALIGVQMRTPFTSGLTYVVDWDTFSLNATTEVESDLTLFTTPAGFRFPYGWTNDGYLNHNMKFLELEISKYLHKHEEGVA